MRIAGLGSPTTDLSVPSCGDNPCTWWDEIWTRDACQTFLQCADPTNPLVIAAQKGFTAGVAAEAGQVTGSVLSSAGQAVGQGIGGAASGLGSSLGIPGWVILGGVAIAGLFLVQMLVPRR